MGISRGLDASDNREKKPFSFTIESMYGMIFIEHIPYIDPMASGERLLLAGKIKSFVLIFSRSVRSLYRFVSEQGLKLFCVEVRVVRSSNTAPKEAPEQCLATFSKTAAKLVGFNDFGFVFIPKPGDDSFVSEYVFQPPPSLRLVDGNSCICPDHPPVRKHPL